MPDGIVRVLRQRLASAGVTARMRLSQLVRTSDGHDAEAMHSLEAFLSDPARRLVLARPASPSVSVLVVTFGRAELTLACLMSLCAQNDAAFELILVDNASTDRTGELLRRLKNATIIRNPANLHYAHAVNQAAAAARGRYLLLLNNDAVLWPGAVAALAATLDVHTDAGAVGARILLRNGRLQEAGSIVFADGSTLGYGRGDDADASPYAFLREADYCSAACLMVRRSVFESVGGMSLHYQPAYYEDTDLCFAIREAGMRVLYQPGASVTHAEFGSSSPEHAAALCTRNRPVFARRWKHRLQDAPAASTRFSDLRERENARAVR